MRLSRGPSAARRGFGLQFSSGRCDKKGARHPRLAGHLNHQAYSTRAEQARALLPTCVRRAMSCCSVEGLSLRYRRAVGAGSSRQRRMMSGRCQGRSVSCMRPQNLCRPRCGVGVCVWVWWLRGWGGRVNRGEIWLGGSRCAREGGGGGDWQRHKEKGGSDGLQEWTPAPWETAPLLNSPWLTHPPAASPPPQTPAPQVTGPPLVTRGAWPHGPAPFSQCGCAGRRVSYGSGQQPF